MTHFMRNSRHVLPVLMAFVFFACPVAAYAFLGGLFGDSSASVKPRDGVVSVDASSVAKGQSKHFLYQENDIHIRFFLVRDEQGTVRMALDACEVCWHAGKGYKLENGSMVCVNCGQRFALSRIGLTRGGCNPHPVAFNSQNDIVTIDEKELVAGARYFPENPK